MAVKNLTDRTLKALKPAEPGKHYDIMDAGFPGFGVRVSEKGTKTFVLVARYPDGSNATPNPTRRALGKYGPLELAAAREKAREWVAMIKKGIDPTADQKLRAKEATRAAALKQERTFFAVSEAFIAEKLPTERSGKDVERDIRGIFVPVWGDRPIDEIDEIDVLSIINAKKKSAPARARNLLGDLKRLFNWAIDQRVYGIKSSPCDRLKATAIIGEKVPRQHSLSDLELRAFWRAVETLQYPHKQMYQMLVLSGLRLNEVAEASWSEIDLLHKLWVIPAARMKARNSKARPHAVPLTTEMLAILEDIKREQDFSRGQYIFSLKRGKSAVAMTGHVKDRLDELMQKELGDTELNHWVNHDLRRTVRTNMSKLRIRSEVAEAVLAHKLVGIEGIYNVDDMLDEKREALAVWGSRLASIVSPPAGNVVELAVARK